MPDLEEQKKRSISDFDNDTRLMVHKKYRQQNENLNNVQNVLASATDGALPLNLQTTDEQALPQNPLKC